VKSRSTLLTKLGNVYNISKKWIIYLDLFLILVLLYFGDFLAPLRDILLPTVVVSILAILLETIQSLEAGVSKSFVRREFPTILEAIPMLCEAVSHDKDRTIVEIIASTGGTTVSSVLPRIMQSSKASIIEISIHLVNPDSVFTNWFPSHWSQEAQVVIERVKSEIRSDRVRLTVYTYDNLPVLHGIMIDKTDLLLGFFGWKHFSGKVQLSGAERPHRYFTRKEVESDYFFDLFEDWLEYSPSQLVYRFPQANS
jgi:hypothetical protein